MDGSFGATRLTEWWRDRGGSFLGTVAITTLAVVVIGWLTGLRTVMHGAFLSVAAVALLPFVFIAVGLLLLMGTAFVLALPTSLAGDHPGGREGLYGAGELVLRGSRWFASRYYWFIGRQRHPLFWGVPTGFFFGGLVLWGLIVALVLPGEARTVRVLGQSKATIDDIYQHTGEFPRPDDQGHLTRGALRDGSAAAAAAVLDGFGRPLHYEVSGRWKLASYVLVSSGFDGKEDSDDLCISGATKLARLVAQATELADLLQSIGAGTASAREQLAGVRALKCPAK